MKEKVAKYSFSIKFPDGVETKTKIVEPYDEDSDNLSYILDIFKRFLRSCGWHDVTLSQIQFLEDEEWKEVLTKYDEWDTEKERVYKLRNDFKVDQDD